MNVTGASGLGNLTTSLCDDIYARQLFEIFAHPNATIFNLSTIWEEFFYYYPNGDLCKCPKIIIAYETLNVDIFNRVLL